MNKIKVLVITIIFIFLSLIPIMYIYKHSPSIKATTTAASNADLAFAVLGDVHGNSNSLQAAINDLYTINSSMDALVLNGDTVDEGLDKQYNSVKKVLDTNSKLLPKKIIKNIGNHEFFDYDKGTNSPEQVQSFINKYFEFSGEQKVYHDTWIKDYHFISLGSEDSNSKTVDSITAFISDEQLNWFKEKLGEKYQKGRPIFVFLHQPLYFNFGDKSYSGAKQSQQIKEILLQYPEAILLSSHIHKDLNENSVVLNQPFTTINTGSIAYILIPDANSKNSMRREAYIEGLYIEVRGSNVVVKGRNNKGKQWMFTKTLNL